MAIENCSIYRKPILDRIYKNKNEGNTLSRNTRNPETSGFSIRNTICSIPEREISKPIVLSATENPTPHLPPTFSVVTVSLFFFFFFFAAEPEFRPCPRILGKSVAATTTPRDPIRRRRHQSPPPTAPVTGTGSPLGFRHP